MPTQTFLFYDIETTGLNKCFDQVLQFAAIRTDMELNEISRHEIRIKLNPDVIPSPYAVITHLISLSSMQQGTREVEAMREIHALLNTPGTVSVGYNTLGFDDEFLRFSFYRNLLPPYTHQYANQCARMDIYPITILYHLFKPEVLQWPTIEGKLSLKLENIAAANNLLSGQSHDAMNDVITTLKLAKIFKADTKMWNYVCGYFDKQTDIKRSDQLPIIFEDEKNLFREGIIVNGKIGAHHNFMAPVISLGQHRHYKNQSLWLRLDTNSDQTYVIRKKMGEQDILLPPEERYLAHISNESLRLAQENKARLLNNTKLLYEIREYHLNYKYPYVPNVDVDAALYDMPFATSLEEKLFREFHQATPDKKLAVATTFPNSRRREQALRILARNYPEVLSDAEKCVFTQYVQSPAVDFRGDIKLQKSTLLENIQEIKTKHTLTETQKTLLEEFSVLP